MKAPTESRARIVELAAFWAVLITAAVVPLLMDLGNYDESYYGIKARNLAAMAVVLALTLIAGRRRARSPIDGPLLIYAGAVIAATTLSVAPVWSLWGAPNRFEGAIPMLSYAIIAAAAARLSVPRIRTLVAAMLIAGVIAAGYGIIQYFGIDPVLRDPGRLVWTRAFSTTGGPNWLGGYMLMLLPLGAAMALAAPDMKLAIPYTAGVVVMFAALLATESRSAWAGTIIAACLLVGMARHFSRDLPPGLNRRIALVATPLAIVAGLFFLPGGPAAGRGEMGSMAARVQDVTLDTQGMAERKALWTPTAELLARRPVFGYGPDTFRLVFPQTWTEQWQRLKGPTPLIIDRAHNQLLDLGMSIGLVGVAGYLWAVLSLWRAAWRASIADQRGALLLAACLAGVTGYLAQIQWQFSVVSVAPVYWTLLGVGAALATVKQDTTG